MKQNPIEEKSFNFAVRTVRLYRHLTESKHEHVLSKQLLRSGTSIGANVSEAERGQSKADFTAKMSIALKEANETYYWLRLLHASEFLNVSEFESMDNDLRELIAMLISICKTANSRK
jgi:four helix bundle protein